MRYRLVLSAAALFAAISAAASATAQQPRDAMLKESAIARGRRAAEVRDSLMRVYSAQVAVRGLEECPAIQNDVQLFLAEPYARPAVTLAALDSALANVNGCLAKLRNNSDLGNFGDQPEIARGAATVAGVFGGGALPTAVDLAVGVTDFMVERAKDEVAFGFVVTLRKNIRDDRFIRGVLPRSYDLMQRIDSETFQTFMPLLRSSFVEDLNELPVRSDSIATILDLKPGQRAYLQGVAITYARGLEIRRGAPPAIALSNLMEVTEQQMENNETRRALRTVGLLAREYGAGGAETMVQELTDRNSGWVRRYFLAFIAHDLTSLEVFPDPAAAARWRQAFAAREADAVLLLNQIHAVRNTLPGGKEGAEEETAANRDGERAQDADRVVAAVGAVLEVLRTAPRFAYLPGGSKPESVQEFETFVGDATLLHQALTRRDYGSAVSWLLQNPNVRLCSQDTERKCEVRLKYLSFASSLAAARNAEEVTTALQAASAPVGSFRAKRSQRGEWFAPRSVSVVGYLGPSGYRTEAAKPGDDADSHIGMGLPVGAELSLGMPWGGLSLLVPVVDFGPLANESIGLADEEETGEFGWDQVLAPGIGVVFNLFRDFPASLGLGVQSVRRERTTENGSRTVNVTRSFLFLGVDATLFNFRF